jgi:hypothetical protein
VVTMISAGRYKFMGFFFIRFQNSDFRFYFFYRHHPVILASRLNKLAIKSSILNHAHARQKSPLAPL